MKKIQPTLMLFALPLLRFSASTLTVLVADAEKVTRLMTTPLSLESVNLVNKTGTITVFTPRGVGCHHRMFFERRWEYNFCEGHLFLGHEVDV
jgi:hypothetical protein